MLNRTQEEALRRELCGEISDETYSHNWLIEAGAGAGKTYTMVNRVVNQLLRGLLKPEQLAAITFTEKATQEMLTRIDAEFVSRLKQAEETGDTAGAAKLRSLLDSVDQMQISTIHAFCRRLLLTMPYESALGPDFELLEETDTYAGAFFDRAVAADPTLFREARELVGVSHADLRYNFQKLCESGAELELGENTDTAAVYQSMELAASQLHSYLMASDASWSKVNKPTSKTVMELAAQLHKVDRLLKGPKEIFTRFILNSLNPFSWEVKVKPDTLARLTGRTISKETPVIAGWTDVITEGWHQLTCASAMPDLKRLISAYRRDKLANHVASQNDLLLYARDMLQQSPEARSYFHNRYRTVYVDEMQDTDPVQAQLLFYLTCSEESFCAEDWRRCRPVPGCLFLVGDPKQAIYRFRGGDITVYKLLTELFEAGVGEVCRLRINRRSSAEICAFVDRAFADRLTGGDYQAEYLSMDAYHGSAPQSRIVRYDANKNDDAERVAAFIAEMLRGKTLVGMGDEQHAARCGDFMVLTRKKDSTARYVKALAARGIPCSMAGERKLEEVQPVARAAVVLQYLADQRDTTKLATALNRGLGISLPMLRAYRCCTGKLSLTDAALSEADGEMLAPVLTALETLQKLREMQKTKAPLAVIEYLLLSVPALWRGETEGSLESDYAMVSQYLSLLRREKAMPFPALAERAVQLAASSVERELLPEEREDCVRVMNLHKAKGLEAEVIILAQDSLTEKKPTRHLVTEGNSAKLYTCFIHNGFIRNYNSTCFKPAGWEGEDGPEAEEKNFLSAEETRLQYVAATRPKTALVINGDKCWNLLEFEEDALIEDINDGTVSLYADRDPNWQHAVRVLRGEEEEQGTGVAASGAPSVSIPSKPLPERVAALAEASEIRISPSKLENHERLPLKEPEEAYPIPQEAPHGAYWGTIVHRMLELLVRTGEYTPEAADRYARLAVSETLSDTDIPKDALAMLLEGHTLREEETVLSYVTEKAAAAAAFLLDAGHPLRTLLAAGTAYPELPFALQLSDTASSLAQAVYAVTGEGEKPVYMNGIIDLAIYDGSAWTLVDYKTDIFLPGETEEDFIARLKRSYSPQLRAYRDILTRLGRGEVAHTYLCALNLSASLIELQ